MANNNALDNPALVKILRDGGVAVVPTDTLYGIVGKAEDQNTVERIYKIRKRNPEKPCIILIGEINELKKFSIEMSAEQQNEILKYWPGPVSIILDCPIKKFSYLHRGTNTLAFRIPALAELRNFLMQTGPLLAPSANTEGMPPAESIEEAKLYFGNLVDSYVNIGLLVGKASKVIKLSTDGAVTVFRE